MDGSVFDSVTRLASRANSRRGALRTALGGAAASTVAAIGLAASRGDAAVGKKKKKCKKCKPRALGAACTTNKQCCTEKTNRLCGIANIPGEETLTCCGGIGASCTTAEDCCGLYNCEGGVCES